MKPAELIKKTLSPVTGLSIALMVYGGGLLALNGHWGALWPGALVLPFYPVLFPLLLLPGGTAAVIAAQQEKNYPRTAAAASVFSVVYFCAVMSLYTVFSFNMVSDYLGGVMLFQAAAWAAGAAVLPWALFASADKGNAFFVGLVFLMQLTTIAVAFAGLGLHLGLWGAFFLMWGSMSGVMLFSLWLEQFVSRRSKK